MNEQQKIEELLKPRVEVENKWPGCWLGVGDILTKEGNFYYLKYEARGGKMNVQNVEPFPYLMRPLKWYEKRSVEEMPDYVKDDDGSVYKVSEWDESNVPYVFVDPKFHKQVLRISDKYPLYPMYYPATESEYTAYINSKK